MGRGSYRKIKRCKASTTTKVCTHCFQLRESVRRASKHLDYFNAEISSITCEIYEAINWDAKSKFPDLDCKFLCETKILANNAIQKISKKGAVGLVLVEKLSKTLTSLPDMPFPSTIQKQCNLCSSTFLTTAKTISHIKLCHAEMLGLVFFLRSRPLSELNFYINEVSIGCTSEELYEKIACPRILGKRKLVIKVQKLSELLEKKDITEDRVNLNASNGTSLVNPPTDACLLSENSSILHPFITLRQKNEGLGNEINCSSSESLSWSCFDQGTETGESIKTKEDKYITSEPRMFEDEENYVPPKTSTPKRSNIGMQLANYNMRRKLANLSEIRTDVPSKAIVSHDDAKNLPPKMSTPKKSKLENLREIRTDVQSNPRISPNDINNLKPKSSTPKRTNIGMQLANYNMRRKLAHVSEIRTDVPSNPRISHDDISNLPPKTSTPKRTNIGMQLANYKMKRTLADISTVTFSSDDFEEDETSHKEDWE